MYMLQVNHCLYRLDVAENILSEQKA